MTLSNRKGHNMENEGMKYEIEERDCENCKNHDGKYCQVWECKFEQKEEKVYFLPTDAEQLAEEIIRKCF